MTHGDDFRPHESLEAFSRRLDGRFFFDAGTGANVVLVHGNGDEADTWRHVLPALAAKYRVIALDLPGFGRSAPEENGSLMGLAASVRGLIEALGLERVALVGSSLGASVSSAVAVSMPGRVSSLTIIGGPMPGLREAQPEVSPGIRAMLEPGVGEAYYTGLREAGQDAAYASLEPYYGDLSALSATDRSFLRERVWARVWSDTQRTAFFAALRSMFDPVGDGFLAGLKDVPMQLIWGERDAIVPIAAAHGILAAFAQSRLEVIAGSGHLPQQERPEAVLEALKGFLG